MTEPRQDRKAEIQKRMLRAALSLWGMQPSDAAQLDPVVNLLLGACSAELESVYREISSYQSRILERLAQLLVPEVNRGPVPAYTVMRADPRGARAELSTQAQFLFKRVPPPTAPRGTPTREFYFTPACPVTVVGAKLSHMIADGSLFAIEEGLQRRLVAKAQLPAREAKTIYLGLELHPDCKDLDGLSLYFDWPAHPDPEQDALHLETCQITLAGKTLPLYRAQDLAATQVERAAGAGVDMHFDHMASQMELICRQLQSRFLTLGQVEITPDIRRAMSPLPQELAGGQGESFRQQVGAPLLWLRVGFAPTAPMEVVADAVCVTNAFTAVNRRQVEFLYRLQSGFAVVPIQPGQDFFMALQRVGAGGEATYASSQVTELSNVEEGRYLLRRGGIERFDTRDAAESLRHVLDLVQEESLSFHLYGQDALLPLLRELSVTLNALSAKVDVKTGIPDRPTFLFVKPRNAQENLQITYWACAGVEANSLSPGSKLAASGPEATLTEAAMLVAAPTGGRGPLTPDESLDAFKNALLTRERIVTEADLRHFLAAQLGANMRSVRMARNYRPSKRKDGGFEKVLRVDLKLAGEMAAGGPALKQSLLTKIRQASSGMIDYELNLAYETSN